MLSRDWTFTQMKIIKIKRSYNKEKIYKNPLKEIHKQYWQ